MERLITGRETVWTRSGEAMEEARGGGGKGAGAEALCPWVGVWGSGLSPPWASLVGSGAVQAGRPPALASGLTRET